MSEILTKPTPYSDAPAEEDLLGRKSYAKALAFLIENTTPPFTIGLFGGWGTGKTTLLRFVEQELNDSCQVVRFNAWEYQDEEAMPVSLLHALVDQSDTAEKKDVIDNLKIIGAVFCSEVIKKLSGISAIDVAKSIKKIQDMDFKTRSTRSRIMTHFAKLTKAACPENGKVVFFIDDLDRCGSEKAIKLLETLKIYFDLENCIFIVAADSEALLASVPNGDHAYLEKIFQIELYLPPINEDAHIRYIYEHTPFCETHTAVIIEEIAGSNPRKVKRLINKYIFALGLAMSAQDTNEMTQGMAQVVLISLILKDCAPNLHRHLIYNPEKLSEITGENLSVQGAIDKFSPHISDLLKELSDEVKTALWHVRVQPEDCKPYLLTLADKVAPSTTSWRHRYAGVEMFKEEFTTRFNRGMKLGELERYYEVLESIVSAKKTYKNLSMRSMFRLTDCILEEFIRTDFPIGTEQVEIEAALKVFTESSIDDITERLGSLLE